MNSTQLQQALQEFLSSGEIDAIREVQSYRDAEILTNDAGLVVRTDDGREFQITILQTR